MNMLNRMIREEDERIKRATEIDEAENEKEKLRIAEEDEEKPQEKEEKELRRIQKYIVPKAEKERAKI
jgi:multimeric flavodoxin WrbA